MVLRAGLGFGEGRGGSLVLRVDDDEDAVCGASSGRLGAEELTEGVHHGDDGFMEIGWSRSFEFRANNHSYCLIRI
jgi:hypothetical protein